ncbi:hypothetical protein GGF50DRAFT_87281 [Schizophyllum commune]
MAGDEEIQVDISATAVCRILTVSTSRRQATALVNLVKCLDEASSSHATASEEEQIPWTISNKYYSADVHFAPHAIHGLSPHRVQNVPAVIFAWSHGEAYKHHIRRLANDLDGYEPEVCLAVRLDPSEHIKDEDRADEEDLREEENAIDEFLASHGFEFVDASARSTPRAEESTETHTESMSHGIPRLPRVVDALSTIMWPSMQSQARPRATRGRSAELLDWAQDSSDTSIALDNSAASADHSRAAVDDVVARSGTGLAAQEGRMRREMEALERWLEKDDFDFHDDPWRFSARAGRNMVSSPLSEDSLSVFGARTPSAAQTPGATQSPAGFDDDFTVFVSAPPAEAHDSDASFTSDASFRADTSFNSNASLNSHTSFDAPFSFNQARSRSNSLAPHAGPFYHSLGSVSDFGDEQAPGSHDILPSDDEDEDLPSQVEIREASARIFGAPHASSSSAGASSSAAAPSSSTAPNTTSAPSDATTAAPRPVKDDQDDPDDYEMAPFDLSRVMSALQGMKEEIAGMENEDERRKAAAKVALGLVYGLEAERRGDGDRVGGEEA